MDDVTFHSSCLYRQSSLEPWLGPSQADECCSNHYDVYMDDVTSLYSLEDWYPPNDVSFPPDSCLGKAGYPIVHEFIFACFHFGLKAFELHLAT